MSLAFPAVSEKLTCTFRIVRPIRLRSYGNRASDLDVDFNQALRPELETQLLCCCTQDAEGNSVDPDFFWHMGVSQRIEALLNIVFQSVGQNLEFSFACPQANCQKMMASKINLASLHQLQESAGQETATVTLGQQSLKIRRPTGKDQLAWLTQTDESSLQFMIQRLLMPSQSTDTSTLSLSQTLTEVINNQTLPDVNQALDSLDPLVDFTVSMACPHCNQAVQHNLDLGGWALNQLRRSQQQLLFMVHQLAYHYHWSETEIFAIPNWRRLHYLSLIDREEGRS